MQYKDTSQQAFLIIYLICILSFIYYSLGRSWWVSHFSFCGHPWLRLMSESEVNRLKTGTFTFRFETLPPSSCLSHLTLLVSHLSLRDKLNLICDVEVFAGLFFSPAPTRFYSAPTRSHDIFTVCSHFCWKTERSANKFKFSLHKILFILFVLSRVLNLLT